MAAAIDVRGLHYRYEDGTVALRGVDFHLEAGEAVALLGPNGSGKTTFVLHLNGLLAGEGTVDVCGIRVSRESGAVIRRKIGMVFQDADSQLFMPTVIDDVSFGPLNHGVNATDARKRALAALDRVGMSAAAGRTPYHLSAGEKKRVAIAGVLAMDPEILILDEPTTFLDPPARRDLTALLAGLSQAKIVVTHDMRFAGALCSRAAFFDAGKIVAEGTVAELMHRFDWD